METLLQTVAMALDTLPAAGRVLLLAVLLAVALYAFTRAAADTGLSVNVMYRKGALVVLVLVPVVVYLTNIQMPVHMQDAVAFDTMVPANVSMLLLLLWALGVVYHGLQLVRALRRSISEARSAGPAHSKIVARTAHWCSRLGLPTAVEVRCSGAEQPWHVPVIGGLIGGPVVVVLPAAARHWPVGVVDVMLLQQLAQVQQHAWAWWFYARLVQVLYWPLPWVARLAAQLARMVIQPCSNLAAAAYGDAEGWRRDVRNFHNRAATLTPVVVEKQRLRLPGVTMEASTAKPSVLPDREDTLVTEQSFEQRWAGTKARLRRKYHDPHEQAYWLIAVVCVLVGVASTLTIVKAPPEFAPSFLEEKWRDSMVRRIKDDDEVVPRPQQPEPAADSKDPPAG